MARWFNDPARGFQPVPGGASVPSWSSWSGVGAAAWSARRRRIVASYAPRVRGIRIGWTSSGEHASGPSQPHEIPTSSPVQW